MKLGKYIKPKPWFFKFVPILSKYTANSLYSYIFVPHDVYEDLKSQNPNYRHRALLIHEETHRERQRKMGWFVFGVNYLFSSKFRFNEELLAVREAMRFLKKNNISFDFEKSSRLLSSYLYLWPVSKHYAKRELERLWEEV